MAGWQFAAEIKRPFAGRAGQSDQERKCQHADWPMTDGRLTRRNTAASLSA